MCHKFIQPKDYNKIYKDFNITSMNFEKTQLEVIPMRQANVIVSSEKDIVIKSFQYGIIRSDNKNFYNTRYESMSSLPMWKYNYHNHRCLVPLESFYEGPPSHCDKYTSKSNILYAAGIYNLRGEFTIVTCKALGVVADNHARYPLFLDKTIGKRWIDNSTVLNFSDLFDAAISFPATLRKDNLYEEN